MSERRYDEKEEKQEKQEEKEEKSWDEKWRRDPLSAMVWAGILIWAGLVLLASNLGLFDQFETLDAWGLVFLGVGGIILLEVLIRLAVPAYRRPVLGTLILAVVFLAIGLGGIVDWNWSIVWPIVLVAIGVILILRGFVGGTRRQ